MTNSVLELWTIYDHPADYPSHYVARLFHNDQPTGQVHIHQSLDALRQPFIDAGLYCLVRSPDDHPTIIETWL